MKKLYVGLGVSFALIIGGVAYGIYARPAVDMTKLGKIFYKENAHYEMPRDNKVEYKLVSLNGDNLKMRIDFKDYSGTDNLTNLMASSSYDGSNMNSKDKKAVEKFFRDVNEGKESSKDKQKKIISRSEIINYKWIEKPFNMSLVEGNEEKYKNKYGNEQTDIIYSPIQENGEIALSGNMEFKKLESQRIPLKVNGIKGSGVLEVEYKVTY